MSRDGQEHSSCFPIAEIMNTQHTEGVIPEVVQHSMLTESLLPFTTIPDFLPLTDIIAKSTAPIIAQHQDDLDIQIRISMASKLHESQVHGAHAISESHESGTLKQNNIQNEIQLCGPPDVYGQNFGDPAIGAGTFGRVYFAKHLKLRGKVVFAEVDICVKQAKISDRYRKMLRNEMTVLRLCCDHDNIIRCEGLYVWEENAILLLEYVPGITLETLIRSKQMTRKVVLSILGQILNGLEYLHSKNVIHYDIKPGNILCEGEHDDYKIKIIDFGLAHITSSNDSCLPSTKKTVCARGTFTYMAPEVMLRKEGRWDQRIDVFSAGATALHMITSITPYYHIPAIKKIKEAPNQQKQIKELILQEVEKGNTRALQKYVTKQCQGGPLQDVAEIVCKMLHFDQNERPDTIAVLTELDCLPNTDEQTSDEFEPSTPHLPAMATCSGQQLMVTSNESGLPGVLPGVLMSMMSIGEKGSNKLSGVPILSQFSDVMDSGNQSGDNLPITVNSRMSAE